MTNDGVIALAKSTAEVLKGFISQRLASVEARLSALEAKPALRFCGVWSEARLYQAGDCATHGGSMWVCLRATRSRPGDGSTGWRLAVKRGDA